MCNYIGYATLMCMIEDAIFTVLESSRANLILVDLINKRFINNYGLHFNIILGFSK
jgi:hypothetical protein